MKYLLPIEFSRKMLRRCSQLIPQSMFFGFNERNSASYQVIFWPRKPPWAASGEYCAADVGGAERDGYALGTGCCCTALGCPVPDRCCLITFGPGGCC